MPASTIAAALGLSVAVTIADPLETTAWALAVIGMLVALAALVLLAAFLLALYQVGSWYEQRQSSEPSAEHRRDAA